MAEEIKLPPDGTRVRAMTYESIEYDRDSEEIEGVLSTRMTPLREADQLPPQCFVNGVQVQPETVKSI